MSEKKGPPPDPHGGGRLPSVWVPLIAAAIVAIAGLIGAVIGKETIFKSQTTTVVENATAPASEPEPAPSAPLPAESPNQATACLPSPAAGDAEDNSIGTPRGPLESGHVYRGTLIKGDEEWWGFCAGSPGRVDIRVENVCDVQGSGATNLIAEVLDASGEEIEYVRPDPGRFSSIALQVEANSPYYVHIYDLDDVDIGGICAEVPWTLMATGDLTAERS